MFFQNDGHLTSKETKAMVEEIACVMTTERSQRVYHTSIFQISKLIAQLTLAIEIILRHTVLNPLVCVRQAFDFSPYLHVYPKVCYLPIL